MVARMEQVYNSNRDPELLSAKLAGAVVSPPRVSPPGAVRRGAAGGEARDLHRPRVLGVSAYGRFS